MNKDRIQRFIQLLKEDAANPQGVKFDMRTWTDLEGIDKWHVPADTKNIKVHCGTQACALGLAAISGIFKDEGLGYKVHPAHNGATYGMLVPTFGDVQEYDAGASFFGITLRDAEKLFGPSYYAFSKRQGADAELEVVRRLELLMQHGTLDGII